MRLPKFVAVILGATAAVAAPLDHASQKKQLEDLLGAVLPFAQKMLAEHGEYYPFGATLNTEGKISQVGGDTGSEHPKSADIIALLKGAYRQSAKSNKLAACALVYDVRTVPPGQTEKADAIAVELDHRDGMSVTMYYPYRIGPDKRVIFGQLFATKGTDDIFPRQKDG